MLILWFISVTGVRNCNKRSMDKLLCLTPGSGVRSGNVLQTYWTVTYGVSCSTYGLLFAPVSKSEAVSAVA